MSVKVLRIAMAQGEWSFPSHPGDFIRREAVEVLRMLRARPLGGPLAWPEWGWWCSGPTRKRLWD